MAVAVAMQATHLRPGPVTISASPSSHSRPPSSASQLGHNRSLGKGDSGHSAGSESQPPVCEGCKHRNSRCAMNQRVGKCYSCEFHRQECVFTPVRSRKRSYDEAIEGLKTLTSAHTTLPTTVKARRADTDTEFVPTGNADLKDGLTRQDRRTCRFIGGTTDMELSLLESLPSEALPFLGGGLTRVERYDAQTFMEIMPSTTYDASVLRIGELEKLILPHQHSLIDFYLANVQPTFPILSNTDVTSLKSARHELEPALLAAIYLLASLSTRLTTADTISSLEDLASNLVQESMIQPRLSTIQAALIVAQCFSMNSSLLTMQINAAAYDLGLYQDCLSWNIAQSQKCLRRRLAWVLYAHDKWTAFSAGRPSLISLSNWTVQPLTPTDFEASSSLTPTAELFTSYITLSTLLSSVLDTFYTLSSASMTSPQQILALAKPVQLQLKEWYSNLPPCLKMDNSVSNSGANSPVPEHYSSKPLAFLHLAYFTTEILLHRRIIRSLSPSSTSSAPTSYTLLHHICRLAAKTRLVSSLDFCNRLRPDHISAFWPVGSRTQFAMIGSFGTLLLATSPTKEEEDFYSARLQEFRWTLGVCSATAGHDCLGFADALDKLDLGLDLWQKGRDLKGVTSRSVRDVAEEMKKTQIHDVSTWRQAPSRHMIQGLVHVDGEDSILDMDFDDASVDEVSIIGSDD